MNTDGNSKCSFSGWALSCLKTPTYSAVIYKPLGLSGRLSISDRVKVFLLGFILLVAFQTKFELLCYHLIFKFPNCMLIFVSLI